MSFNDNKYKKQIIFGKLSAYLQDTTYWAYYQLENTYKRKLFS